ncbi:hypothetical protein BJP40_14710 [Streptomyces sp. CC53]|uniref:hypothetical protein n=1 Tax=unclassified Streptomyces TaxID=2593676 RepID=UPI0008DE982B|nr:MULTISPECIES: hypothetical protein [unclassified Streptomyces]OII66090.1 hypothetical protein BJP40_14710 [Streptomyces sp. CC53]
MGVTRTLSELGPAGLAFLGLSLAILAFSVGCYVASFPRRRRDARAVHEGSRGRSSTPLSHHGPPPPRTPAGA